MQTMWINMHRFWYQVCATFSPFIEPLQPLLDLCFALAPPSLHPGRTMAPTRIRPAPLSIHFTTYPFLGLFTSFSASFFSVGGDGGRQEAVEKRRGKVQRKRGKAQVDRYQWDTHGTRIGTYRKAMKSRHFNVVIPTRNQHQNLHNWIV